MKWIIECVLIGLIGWVPVWAQGIDDQCTQNAPSACIDWDRGVVIAEGIGAPAQTAPNPAVRNASALRAARLDAARNILEMIKGVNLSSATTMQNAMVSDDVVRTQVQGYLHGLRPIGEPRYFSDGTIKVRLEARLQNTIPQELVFRQEQGVSSQLLPSSQNSTVTSEIRVDQVYTGLIIDGRETNVQPAMSPKIFDEHGKQVYGSAYVDREFVVKHGMAGYVKDIEKAKQNDRVKGAPLIIKAANSAGKNQADLVISNVDADKLRQIAQNQSFLREARVVVVLK